MAEELVVQKETPWLPLAFDSSALFPAHRNAQLPTLVKNLEVEKSFVSLGWKVPDSSWQEPSPCASPCPPCPSQVLQAGDGCEAGGKGGVELVAGQVAARDET